ncbi:MAG: dnaE [Hyphomicrobiales bacterium]|nr:dnaE [Hyphomicrobiales bacterium]
MSAYAEFAVTSNFTFLRGASHPEEMVAQAMELGLTGIGIADRNSLAGVVRAHVYARENEALAKGLRVVTGARLVFCDGTPDILAYPRDRAAYGRLSRLLTRGNLRAEKGDCRLMFEDLGDHAEGLQLAILPSCSGEAAAPGADHSQRIAEIAALARDRVWIAACMSYGRQMRRSLMERHALAQVHRLPLLATNDVHMHTAARRPLADVLTCVREGVTIDSAGTRLAANAERHLKSPREMARLFREAPEAIGETQAFLKGISFSLDQLAYEYPDELREGFASEQEALIAFTWQGAAMRYPEGVPEKISAIIRHELQLVAEMKYAAYFLTVHDIVRFARQRGILCQGRGSAANSAVCFCLGITEVDPTKHDLLFERFISPERKEPPDIDVDFEHERREEVMQYIYARYGRLRAGLTATVISYRARSAIRDVGKAFGFSEDSVAALSSTVWGWWSGAVDDAEIRRIGFDPSEPRLAQTVAIADELTGFPRHLSQHTGGFVITRARLDEVVPVANAAMVDRTTIEWDKDDLDSLGILKIDVLALGMLSCLRKGFDLLRAHYGRDLTLATLPSEERCVYEMISRADTIGVFQIESRAQMSMLPRLKPAKFYDLVIEVAIVRPGPIQGDMVHPYLRRRQGLEKVTYPSAELEAVLGKTLGVPLFQEQAMRIAIVGAGFTPSEADRLRRAMATFKKVGTISTFHRKMVDGMTARGYDPVFAEACFRQIEGFGTYGFPESHAASFALLVYASAWMKCRYPDVFACALLNSQPMGFYAPAQILRDAREHGVEAREVDVNHSTWDNSLERGAMRDRALQVRHESQRSHIHATHAVRIGFRQIKGVRESDMQLLVGRRARGYDSVRDLWLRTGLSPSVLESLAEADAFRSLGLDRRDALWAVRGLNRSGDKDDLPLFRAACDSEQEPEARLPPMPPGEHVVEDYRHLSLSLKAHPVSFLRERLDSRRILRSADLARVPTPRLQVRSPSWKLPRVTVAGLVLVRQRPGSAKGVLFMTIEDETGVANAIVWPKVFETQRAIVIGARFVAITGRLQNEADVIHVVAEEFEDLTPMLGLLSLQGGDVSGLARADEVKRPQVREKKPVPDIMRRLAHADAPLAEPSLLAEEETRRVMPRGRNFH